MKDKNIKIIEFDFMKAVAVILVILSHCLYYRILTPYGGVNYCESVNSNDNIYLFFKNLVDILPMPVYFIVSGALFKKSFEKMQSKGNTVKDLIVKKAKRLLIPFMLVMMFYSTPIKYFSGYWNNSQNIIKDIGIGQFLIQGNTHLWFLPTLFIIFCIVYLVEKKKIYRPIILLAFYILNLTYTKIPILIVRQVVAYLVYFYIGYCLEIYRPKFDEMIAKSKFGIIPLIVCSLILYSGWLFIKRPNILLKAIGETVHILIGVLFSIILYYTANKNKEKFLKSKIISKLSEYSFGIYLYSDPINYAILAIFSAVFSNNFFNNTIGLYITFFSRLVLTLGLSYLITYVLKKLKVKYIC